MLDKGATTFSKPTLNLMTRSKMTLGIVDLIVTLSLKKLSIITLRIRI